MAFGWSSKYIIWFFMWEGVNMGSLGMSLWLVIYIGYR